MIHSNWHDVHWNKCGNIRMSASYHHLSEFAVINCLHHDFRGNEICFITVPNYLLFFQEIKEYFTEEKTEELRKSGKNYKKTVEKEHGGVAVREYYLTEDITWYEDRKKWEKMKVIGMVRKTMRLKSGEIIKEDRYYFGSMEEDIELYERAARGHWGVENGLHWYMDFTFKDDRNTTMEKTGAKNLQILKK